MVWCLDTGDIFIHVAIVGHLFYNVSSCYNVCSGFEPGCCQKASEQAWKTILHLFSFDWFGFLGTIGFVPTLSSPPTPFCEHSAQLQWQSSCCLWSSFWTGDYSSKYSDELVTILCFVHLPVLKSCSSVTLCSSIAALWAAEQLQQIPAELSAAVAGVSSAIWLQYACIQHRPWRYQHLSLVLFLSCICCFTCS